MENFEVDDLKLVVDTLLTTAQTVTNLEIKQELRSTDFWATQQLVSKMMMDNQQDFNLDYSENSGYRKYFKVDVTSDITHGTGISINSQDDQDDKKLVTGNIVDYVKKNGKHVKSILTPFVGDWQAGTKISPNIAYFESEFSRDEVRQAIANFKNVPFQNTRSRIIK
jgi:hypothetical protein